MNQLKYKDLNLLESYYKKPKKVMRKKPITGRVLFIVFIVLALSGTVYYYWQGIVGLSADITELSAFVNDTGNTEKAALDETLLTELSELNRKNAVIEKEAAGFKEIKRTGLSVFNKISACLNEKTILDNITYHSDSSSLSVAIKTADVSECSAFVKRIENVKEFKVISYSGYKYFEDTQLYMMSVEFTLEQT